jgi:hypothetical protein
MLALRVAQAQHQIGDSPAVQLDAFGTVNEFKSIQIISSL